MAKKRARGPKITIWIKGEVVGNKEFEDDLIKRLDEWVKSRPPRPKKE